MSSVAVLALQNLGEAEYVVALFMYMCLLGYPADKISILTTYNGQKHLIRDIINRRCGNNPLIGRPNKVVYGWNMFNIHLLGKVCIYYKLFILFFFVSQANFLEGQNGNRIFMYSVYT